MVRVDETEVHGQVKVTKALYFGQEVIVNMS